MTNDLCGARIKAVRKNLDILFFAFGMKFIGSSSLLHESQSVSFKIFPASATVSTTVSGSMGEAINPHPS